MKAVISSFSEWIDQNILPVPVRVLTSRFIIILTLLLLIPLFIFNGQSWFVLMINSYLNVTSVAVSSIVLLLTKIADEKRERIAAQQEKQNLEIAARQESQRKMLAEQQERRATEDHRRILEMHQTLFREIENFKRILKHVEEMRPELEQMRQTIYSIEQRQATLEHRVSNMVNQVVDEVSDAVEEVMQEAIQEASENAITINNNGHFDGDNNSADRASAEI